MQSPRQWATRLRGGNSGTLIIPPIFGNPVHGNLVVDGTTTLAVPLGAPSSGVYTLTADLYANNLTVNSGATIRTNGFIVFAAGTLTLNGVIERSGFSATASIQPAIQSSGSTSGIARGASANTGGGGGGTLVNFALGGAAGAGGLGSGGSGGVAGVANAPTGIMLNKQLEYPTCFNGLVILPSSSVQSINGGGSGGAGGGDGTNSGGAGGSAGGYLSIVAKTIIRGTGSFEAKGGNGGTPVNAGNTGGGGGGGGGVIVINCNSYTGSLPNPAVDCAGGTGGAKTGTGVAGGNGSAGNFYINYF